VYHGVEQKRLGVGGFVPPVRSGSIRQCLTRGTCRWLTTSGDGKHSNNRHQRRMRCWRRSVMKSARKPDSDRLLARTNTRALCQPPAEAFCVQTAGSITTFFSRLAARFKKNLFCSYSSSKRQAERRQHIRKGPMSGIKKTSRLKPGHSLVLALSITGLRRLASVTSAGCRGGPGRAAWMNLVRITAKLSGYSGKNSSLSLGATQGPSVKCIDSCLWHIKEPPNKLVTHNEGSSRPSATVRFALSAACPS